MKTDPGTDRIESRPAWASWSLLALGVVAASVSAILVRYAEGADALAISFWRCAFGALLLAPFARSGLRDMKRPAAFTMPVIAGAFLAVHFATWIRSLDLTTVASSVLLVSTTPIFVALIAWFAFKDRLPAVGWTGIVMALGGTALVAGVDLGGTSFAGNLLALAGGAMAAGYVLAGGVARRTLGILEYAAVTYAAAAVLLLVVCLAAGVDLIGYPSATWWAIAGIVVGPQLLGHTVINLVLKDIDATTVSAAIMAEPIIAITLAFALFDEVPSILVYPGGAAILAGIYLVSTTARRPGQIPIDQL
ncbi:MAG: DMT family transporter [Actinomycetota bacterium]|nr:DMT family transporter [Actinomycetota bacterium]